MPAEERPVKDDVGKDGKLRFIKWERIARSLKSEETGMESTKLKKVPESEKKSNSMIPLIPKELWSKSAMESEVRRTDEQSRRADFLKQAFSNPLVPLGLATTCGCLIGMCVSAVRRDRMRTQYFMRGRIAAQFFTIAVLAGGAWAISGRRENDSPHDDAIPVAS